MKLLPAWCVLFAVVMANQRVVVSGAGRALLQDSPLPLPETCPDGSTADGNGNCFTCENGAGLQFSESGECSCSDLNPCTSVPAVPSPAEEVPGPAEEVPGPAEEVPGPAEEVPGPAEEVPSPAEEVPGPAEEVPSPVVEPPSPAGEAPADETAPLTCPDGSIADGNGNCFTCENGAGLQFSESGECSCSDLNPCTSVPAVPSTDGDGEDGSAPAGENAPGMSDIHSHAFAFPCLDICLT